MTDVPLWSKKASRTPHPISTSMAERSLSNPSMPTENPSPTTRPTLTADSARSSASGLMRSRTFFLVSGFWLASIAVGIRLTNGWHIAGIVTGAFAGTFAIHWAVSERGASWLKSWSGDVILTSHAVCSECERACRSVTDLETSRPCAGRVHVGQCLVCAGSTVEVVRIGERWTCPNHHLHNVANVKPKPRLSLVKGDP